MLNKSPSVLWLERIEARLDDMNEQAHRLVEDTNEEQGWDDVADTSDAMETIWDLISKVEGEQ